MNRTKVIVRLIAALVVFPVVTVVAFSASLAFNNLLAGEPDYSLVPLLIASGGGVYAGYLVADGFADFILKD